MNRAMRILPALMLILPVPLGAEPAAPAEQGVRSFPQPVVLDWGDEFRLYSPPKNIPQSGLKKAAAADTRPRQPAEATPSARAVAALGAEDHAKTRTNYRSFTGDPTTLNVEAPVKSGPVSLGANYGKFREEPSTREVSAHDVRVSLGVAF